MTIKIPRKRQVYFFMMPEDILCTIQFMMDEKYKLLNTRSSLNTPTEIKTIYNLSQFYFCPDELMRDVEMYKIADDVFVLDATVSPVIEFECSILYSTALSRGRMYFRDGYLRRDKYILFPSLLYKSFEKVYSFMKKNFFIKERTYSAYMTHNSSVYVSRGGKLTQI